MSEKVRKAFEITNAEISFVSLVDKAANKKQFLITKAENNNISWETAGRIIKTDNKTHHVTGIVYEPYTEDAHGEFMSEEEITKAAYWFAKNGNDIDMQHSFKSQKGVSVVENWIAKSDFDIGSEHIRKGTWLITAEIQNDEIWDKISKGEITGFSMGGHGKHSEKDIDLNKLVPKKNTNTDKEASKMTKTEIEKIVSDYISKYFEEKKDSEQSKSIKNATEGTEISYEFITEAVKEAIKEALEPKRSKPETVTTEQVQKMIADAVSEAIEPIRKQIGLPTNLNDNNRIEKQTKQHYLHGIL